MSEKAAPRVKVWTMQTLLENTEEKDGCRVWLGPLAVTRKDPQFWYPSVRHEKKSWRGNRLMLFLITGKLPKELFACHSCDNPKCINPDHLYWGTYQDNVRDREQRKRSHYFKITHCPAGHEYTEENTYLRRTKSNRLTNRVCRECHRKEANAWNKKNRAKKKANLMQSKLESQLAESQRKLKIRGDALEFYANRDNWIATPELRVERGFSIITFTDVEVVGGKRARQALRETENG